jgi:hypothetical protein
VHTDSSTLKYVQHNMFSSRLHSSMLNTHSNFSATSRRVFVVHLIYSSEQVRYHMTLQHSQQSMMRGAHQLTARCRHMMSRQCTTMLHTVIQCSACVLTGLHTHLSFAFSARITVASSFLSIVPSLSLSKCCWWLHSRVLHRSSDEQSVLLAHNDCGELRC